MSFWWMAPVALILCQLVACVFIVPGAGDGSFPCVILLWRIIMVLLVFTLGRFVGTVFEGR